MRSGRARRIRENRKIRAQLQATFASVAPARKLSVAFFLAYHGVPLVMIEMETRKLLGGGREVGGVRFLIRPGWRFSVTDHEKVTAWNYSGGRRPEDPVTAKLKGGLQEASGYKVIRTPGPEGTEVFDQPGNPVRRHPAAYCQRPGPTDRGRCNVDGGDLPALLGEPDAVAAFAAPEIQRGPWHETGDALNQSHIRFAGPSLSPLTVQALPELPRLDNGHQAHLCASGS
jgi:hypothetical protein